MPFKRYVTTSEATLIVCNGAALFAKVQDLRPNSVALHATLDQWNKWKADHPDYVAYAVRLQARVFDTMDLEAEDVRPSISVTLHMRDGKDGTRRFTRTDSDGRLSRAALADAVDWLRPNLLKMEDAT